MTLIATCPIILFIGRQIPRRGTTAKLRTEMSLGWQFLSIGSGFLESYIERDFAVASGLAENEWWVPQLICVMSALFMAWWSYPDVGNICGAPDLEVAQGLCLVGKDTFPYWPWALVCFMCFLTKQGTLVMEPQIRLQRNRRTLPDALRCFPFTYMAPSTTEKFLVESMAKGSVKNPLFGFNWLAYSSWNFRISVFLFKISELWHFLYLHKFSDICL